MIVLSIRHRYIQCSFVSDIWVWIYHKILHLDPFLVDLEDFHLIQLKFDASIHDNAIIWLLGNYVLLVEKEVVSKNNKLSLPFVKGFLNNIRFHIEHKLFQI